MVSLPLVRGQRRPHRRKVKVHSSISISVDLHVVVELGEKKEMEASLRRHLLLHLLLAALVEGAVAFLLHLLLP